MADLGVVDLRSSKTGPPRFRSCKLFLVGTAKEWGSGRGSAGCLIQSDSDLQRGFVECPGGSVWVAHSASSFAPLARSRPAFSDRRLLVLRSVPDPTHQVLTAWFRHVVVSKAGMALLKASELLEALSAANAKDLFVGGAYDPGVKVVILYRGSLEPLVVPASWFKEEVGARVDLRRLAVTDYGQTVSFGDREVAADAILYEFDAEYRRRARKNEIATDRSLGGSIRRLRLQKGFTQSDFALPLKTIARIERGEVQRPQAATLRVIARRLGVSMEELGTY